MQNKNPEKKEEKKLHDYNVYIYESNPGIIHTVHHELAAARRIRGQYSLEFVVDAGRTPVGITITESHFAPEELDAFLKRSVANKVGYKIEELSRDPLELRKKLRESRAVEEQAMKDRDQATKAKIKAESELGQWVEIFSGYENHRDIVKMVLTRISGQSKRSIGPSKERFDPSKLDDHSAVRSYIDDFFNAFPDAQEVVEKVTSPLEKARVSEVSSLGPEEHSHYISLDEAADSLFGLRPQDQAYQAKHREVVATFSTYLQQGAFNFKPFNNFDQRNGNGTVKFNRDLVHTFTRGEVETLDSSDGNPKKVTLHYAVKVQGSQKLEVFELGAYTEEDAMTKYGFTRMKLLKNSESQGGRISFIERRTITREDGSEVVMYTRPDLEFLAVRQK